MEIDGGERSSPAATSWYVRPDSSVRRGGRFFSIRKMGGVGEGLKGALGNGGEKESEEMRVVYPGHARHPQQPWASWWVPVHSGSLGSEASLFESRILGNRPGTRCPTHCPRLCTAPHSVSPLLHLKVWGACGLRRSRQCHLEAEERLAVPTPGSHRQPPGSPLPPHGLFLTQTE